MDWGHYSNVVDAFEFVLFMLGWSLLAVDLAQQVHRLRRKYKEREQWRQNVTD